MTHTLFIMDEIAWSLLIPLEMGSPEWDALLDYGWGV